MDDHKEVGLVNLLEVAAIPVQFRCWPELLLAQIMLPHAHVSFTGHLCGIFAGLLHVYLPKAGTALHILLGFVWPVTCMLHKLETVSYFGSAAGICQLVRKDCSAVQSVGRLILSGLAF